MNSIRLPKLITYTFDDFSLNFHVDDNSILIFGINLKTNKAEILPVRVPFDTDTTIEKPDSIPYDIWPIIVNTIQLIKATVT